MRLVTFGPDLSRIKKAADLYEGIEYIVPESQYRDIWSREQSSGLNLISSVRDIPQNWSGQPAKKILVYSSGTDSEKLRLTSLVHSIKEKNPYLKIDIAVDAGSMWIWHGGTEQRINKDIYSFRMLPVPASVLASYDGSILLDEEDEFEHGVPILRVFQDEELECWSELNPSQKGVWNVNAGYMVLGLDAPRTRALPLDTYLDFIDRVRVQYGNVGFYGLSRSVEGEILQQELEKRVKKYAAIHNKISNRKLACFLRLAGCIISPSDLYIDLAAAVNTPSVELCSTKRGRDYPLNVPIFKEESCSIQCNWNHSDFRTQSVNLITSTDCYTPLRAACKRMEAINGRDIFLAFTEAYTRKFSKPSQFPPLPE